MTLSPNVKDDNVGLATLNASTPVAKDAAPGSADANSSGADGVWLPGVNELARSRFAEFCRLTGHSNLPSLDQAARSDPARFWGQVAAWLDLDWQVQPTATVDQLDEPHATRWFPGGKLNLTDNAVDRWVRRGRGGQIALTWETESGSIGQYTFSELAAEIDRVGHGLQQLGICPGDTVGFQLPLIAESAVAQLALAKIGAVAVPVFSGFGAGAVADRLALAGAVAHIVADGFDRRGRTVQLREQTVIALGRVTTLRHTIVVSVSPDSQKEPVLPGEVSWSQLGTNANGAPLDVYECPTDHPLLIAFTSGTTGKPKGVVLGHAGFAIKAGSDAAFCFDVGQGDIASWITDPGWIMSPITLLGGLLAGCSVALYSGSVDHPSPDRLWQVVRHLGITMLGISPTLVRSLIGPSGDLQPPDIGALRVFASSGEPWTPDAYSWLFDRIGQGRLPIINYSGGTEVSGAILSNTTMQPIHPCGFAGPLPGMAADMLDADGAHLAGGLGELALRSPSPGMPLTFWQEPDRYRTTYWERWPGTWYHGDWVEIDQAGVWFIRGRSDDTLNVAGKRLGPAEVEAVTNSATYVVESAAIGVPDTLKGEALVVFVRLDPTRNMSDDIARKEIEAAIVAQLGKPLKPKAVLFADQLPRTRSGKILRRVIRSVYLDKATGDTSSLDDPDALDCIRNAR